MAFDINQAVTDRIVTELESGIIPWEKPWVPGRVTTETAANTAYSESTGRAYNGINQWILSPGSYATYKYVSEHGGHVRKGEKGHMVVFWKIQRITEKGADNTETIKTVPLLRYYTVFNITEQCEGIVPRKLPERNRPVTPDGTELVPDEVAETVIARYLGNGGPQFDTSERNRAYYAPGRDIVCVPAMGQFRETAEYYSTAFHELTHSTGHESRLNRGFKSTQMFGDSDYSKEELVAEIGAATLCNLCGLETEKSFRNSTAYIQSWLSALQNDKRMIVSASGKADKAVCYILGNDEYALPGTMTETV